MHVRTVIIFNPDDGKQPKTFGLNNFQLIFNYFLTFSLVNRTIIIIIIITTLFKCHMYFSTVVLLIGDTINKYICKHIILFQIEHTVNC